MKNNCILVEYDGNWAGELDVKGTIITTLLVWESFVAEVQEHFDNGYTLKSHIGTNQYIEYDSFDDWISCYAIKSIPDTDAVVLRRYSNYLTGDFYSPDELHTTKRLAEWEAKGWTIPSPRKS